MQSGFGVCDELLGSVEYGSKKCFLYTRTSAPCITDHFSGQEEMGYMAFEGRTRRFGETEWPTLVFLKYLMFSNFVFVKHIKLYCPFRFVIT